MLLNLKKDGSITYNSVDHDREVNLDNMDIQNALFSKFLIEDRFSFKSLFQMFKNYPFLLVIFPIMKDYLAEFEAVDLSKTVIPSEFFVLTRSITIVHQLITTSVIGEIYNQKNVYQEDKDIGLMLVKDYCNYDITLNTLAALNTEISGDSNIETVYLNIDPIETYDYLSFLRNIVEKISIHGFVNDRNLLMEELRKEKISNEEEADRLASKIMDELND